MHCIGLRALSVALDGFSEGAYEPARPRMPEMLAEEAFHHDLGVAWFRKLASGSKEARVRLRDSVLSMLGRMLAWLMPADQAGQAQAASGLVPEGAVLRARFEGRYGELLSLVVDIDVTTAQPEREAVGRGPGPRPMPPRRGIREAREGRPQPNAQASVSSYWCRGCRSPFEVMKWRGRGTGG